MKNFIFHVIFPYQLFIIMISMIELLITDVTYFTFHFHGDYISHFSPNTFWLEVSSHKFRSLFKEMLHFVVSEAVTVAPLGKRAIKVRCPALQSAC